MNPDRWRHVEQLYHDALERPAIERSAFLDQACGEDGALRNEVEKLIAGHQHAGSFLASPAWRVEAETLAAGHTVGVTSLLDQTLGHYRIAGILGEGGMGVVYRAEDSRLGRAVALKVLAPCHVADPQRLARFLQEARLASLLNHPNIATILDVGEADGHHYIVMELVEGESVARRLGEKPMKLALLTDLATQIGEALAEAHARGIVHRDIKSDNILVTPAGRAKVLDFGLSKRLPQAGEKIGAPIGAQTDTGLVMGTVNYMSPEQALGRPVDERSDLFSFGVVLYEMATGRRPFVGASTTSTIDRLIHEAPFPPAHLNREVPPVLEQVVLKLLEKNVEDRYQSARDLVVDLRRLKRAADAGTLPTTSPRLPTSGRLAVRQWLVPTVALALVATGMLFLGPGGSTPPPQSAMRFSEITNSAGVEAQPALSRDGRSVAFISNRGGQFDIWVALVTGGSPVRITTDPNLEARPQWSPDGSRIAYARLNELGLWDIWIVPALGGTPRRILSNAGDPSWSPDGSQLAYANHSTSGIWISEPSGANPQEVTRAGLRVFHRQPSFSRDASRLVFVSRGYGPYGELVVTDLATRELRQMTRDGAMVQSPVWSPDDHWIYFASSRGGTMNVWKIAADTGELEQLTVGLGDDAALDLSADGRRLVFSTSRLNINLAEADLDNSRGKPSWKWLTTDSARGELAPAYSPDGKRIVYFSNKKGVERERIWIIGADGADPILLVDDGRENIFPRWTPDGQAVMYVVVGPSSEIWRVALSGTPPDRIAEGVTADFVDVNREGRVICYGPGYRVQIVDPATKQVQRLQESRGMSPWGPEGVSRWRPNGDGFVYQAVSDNVMPAAQDLWIVDGGGRRRRIFTGWVAWYEWANPDELIVLEGKPDLKGVLWRVRLDGQRIRTSISVPLISTYEELEITARFGIHPDGRRMVVSVVEFHEADIGMIENIR